MCGRVSINANGAEIAAFLKATYIEKRRWQARYNVGPQSLLPVVRRKDEERMMQFMRWSLVPSWAKDISRFNRTFNARIETVLEKPTFRGVVRHKRCIVPMTGFYEWPKKAPQKGQKKQPFHFTVKDQPFLTAAGMWDYHEGTPEHPESFCSFTILTTDANSLVQNPDGAHQDPFHHRMPVILPKEAWEEWLSPDTNVPGLLHQLSLPFPAENMEARPVSTYVNNSRNEGPECWAAPAP